MAILDNLTIKQALEQKMFGIYVGWTKRTKQIEGMGFLTLRGAHQRAGLRYKDRRQKVVLISKAHRGVLSQKEKEIIGFQSEYVFEHILKLNGLTVKSRLQNLVKNTICEDDGAKVPLGVRLHRWNSMGSKIEDPDARDPSYLGKVFITAAPNAKILEFCEVQQL